jgi:hypothetical protein
MSISDDDNSGSDFVRLHPVYEDEIGNDRPVAFEPINTYHQPTAEFRETIYWVLFIEKCLQVSPYLSLALLFK